MTAKEITEPMRGALIGPDDYCKLRFPLFVSTKYDGIRCYFHRELGAISKSFKPIRNKYVRAMFEPGSPLVGLDGELVAIDPDTNYFLPFNRTQSVINSFNGLPNFVFLAFDYYNNLQPSQYYGLRYRLLSERVKESGKANIHAIPQKRVNNADELAHEISKALSCREEGLIVRNPLGVYRPGKCSFLEQNVMKIKFEETTEATIVGYEELLINTNEAEIDNFNRTKRSKKLEGLIPGNTLGKLICESSEFDGQFAIGSGFTEFQRDELWKIRKHLKGIKVEFKYIPKGVKTLPRSPIFLRIIPK